MQIRPELALFAIGFWGKIKAEIINIKKIVFSLGESLRVDYVLIIGSEAIFEQTFWYHIHDVLIAQKKSFINKKCP